MIVTEVIGGVILTLAGAGVIYTLVAAHLVAGRRKAAFAPSAPISVSVLKPLHGLEPNLKTNLAALLRQDYAAPVQLIVGVQDPESPALAIARALADEHPGLVDVVVDARMHGANRKVSNLINMAGAIRHELVAIADSDIAIGPGYLQALADACAAPGVGVASCAYVGRGLAGLWSDLTAMGVSYGFFPGVIVGAAGGLAAPVMGSTIALRREIFDQIGGFAPLADVLADDYELGRLVTARGARAVLASAIVVHEGAERSFGALFAQELRWAVTVRSLSPLGHIGSAVTHTLPLALIGALVLGGPSWLMVLVSAGSRLWLMSQIDQLTGAKTGARLLWPLRDMISSFVFVWSLFSRSVRWRGARFQVDAQGRLSPSQGE